MSGVLNGPIPFIFEEIKHKSPVSRVFIYWGPLSFLVWAGKGNLQPCPLVGICLLAVTLSTKGSLGLRIWHQQQNTLSNTKYRG